jgi:hypothetical protein
MNDIPRGIGDNSQAGLLADLEPLANFRPPSLDVLEAEIAALIARREQLLAGVERMPEAIDNEETEKRASDMAKMLGAAIKQVDKIRLARNEPAREMQALVNAVYGRVSEPLARAQAVVLGRLTTFQRAKAEADRIRREEEARRHREEAAQARRAAEDAERLLNTDADLDAAISAGELAVQAEVDAIRAEQATRASLADLSRQRGDYGATASLRQYWDFEVADYDQVDLNALRAHLPRDVIDKAIRSYIRAGGRDLGGAQIFRTSRTTVR